MLERVFKFIGVCVGLFFWVESIIFIGGSSSIPIFNYFFSLLNETVFLFGIPAKNLLGSTVLYFFGIFIAIAIDMLGRILSAGPFQFIHDYKENNSDNNPHKVKKSGFDGLSVEDWMMITPLALGIVSWLLIGIWILFQK